MTEPRHPWVCRDEGHEFLCRFGAGSCTRTGSGSCNEPEDDEATDPWYEMDRAVRCLALEVPGSVYDDVKARWEAVKADHFMVGT